MDKIQELLLLNDDDKKKARENYGKSEDDMKRDVGILKEWLRQQPHLPHNEDDRRLERLLISNKCRIELTKQKLEGCYTYRTMYPEVMDYYNTKSDLFKKALKYLIFVPLPKMTDKMERIVYMKPNPDTDFEKDYHWTGLIFLEFLKTFDNSLAFIYIIDCSNVTFDYLKKLDLLFFQKLVNFISKALSGSFSHLICFKAPTYADYAMKIFKLFLKPKLYDRISLTQETQVYSNAVPIELLPIELGGENGSVTKLFDEWCNLLIDNYKFFEDIASKKSNENLRVGPIKANELFGADGSFKKLNLD